MRTGILISTILLLLAASVTMDLPDLFGQRQADVARQSRLEDLLKQRRDTLARAVELIMRQYREGVCGFEELLTARQHLQEAELDAAKTQGDRIAALKKQLEIAKAGVTTAELMFQGGRVTEVDVLQARAALLSVEIGLLRERDVAESKDH